MSVEQSAQPTPRKWPYLSRATNYRDLCLNDLIGQRVDVHVETIEPHRAILLSISSTGWNDSKEGSAGISVALNVNNALQLYGALTEILGIGSNNETQTHSGH